jgi:hypothetical protein
MYEALLSKLDILVPQLEARNNVCWRMLTYASVCFLDILVPQLEARSDGCWRMLTYAGVCFLDILVPQLEARIETFLLNFCTCLQYRAP